jgi:glycosyltransferase involved in cell wall biosynthesis
MRVTYVTARYLPETGGTEIHTHEVAKRMSARGASATVLATSRDPSIPAEEREGDVVVRRVPAHPRRRDWFFAPSLPAAIRDSRPDLLHCQGYHTFVAPMAMWTALRGSIPYIVTLHSGGHSSRLRVLARPAQGRLLRPLLVRARAIVAVSQFEANLFADRLGIAPDRFAVIPSGINLPPVREPAAPPDDGLVLSVGRVETYKGHDRVVEALPALRVHNPRARVRILGSGPHEPQLRRLAERLGVADAVEIARADGREELAALLSRAAVVTALSRYESQGLAVQEAVGLGRPVVVGEGSALEELAVHPNVVTVPAVAGPDEVAGAIASLLQAAPAQAPRLQTWDDCVDALDALYRAAVGADRDEP